MEQVVHSETQIQIFKEKILIQVEKNIIIGEQENESYNNNRDQGQRNNYKRF